MYSSYNKWLNYVNNSFRYRPFSRKLVRSTRVCPYCKGVYNALRHHIRKRHPDVEEERRHADVLDSEFALDKVAMENIPSLESPEALEYDKVAQGDDIDALIRSDKELLNFFVSIHIFC